MAFSQTNRNLCGSVPRRGRRPFQYSLRSLFVAIALLASLLGAISFFFRDTLEERVALVSLRRLGYTVQHSIPLLDGQHPLLNIDCLIIAGDQTFDSEGMALVLRFRKLKTFFLGCDRIEPGTLRQLGGLRSLQFLFIGGSHVDDEGIRGIGNAVGLVQLSISGSAVRGRGLAEVASLKNLMSILLGDNARLGDLSGLDLRHLHDVTGIALDRTAIVGDCLRWLPANCRSVTLRGTNAGDDTLRGLSHCSRLQDLDLSDTRVTGEGLRHLAALPRLNSLGLARCPISDASLESVRLLRSLESLDLFQTPISDSGLDRLCKITQPVDITVSGCPRITAAGVTRLRASLARWPAKGPGGPCGFVQWRNP